MNQLHELVQGSVRCSGIMTRDEVRVAEGLPLLGRHKDEGIDTIAQVFRRILRETNASLLRMLRRANWGAIVESGVRADA